MFKSIRPVLVVFVGVALSACAQQEEAPAITPEPIFDKYGNATGECRSAGYTDPTTGAYSPPQRVPCPPPPPEDGCDPTLSTFDPNCPPPDRDRDERDPGRPAPDRSTRG